MINYRRNNGRPYKYVYGVTYFKLPFAVVKMNVMQTNGPVLKMVYDGANADLLMPSEPVFVERTPGRDESDEDDGVLLVMVLSKMNNDFLSVIDAKTFEELARFEIVGVKFAFSFHGFFADQTLFPSLNK